MVMMRMMMMMRTMIQIQIQIRPWKQVATLTSTAPQGELTLKRKHSSHDLGPRDHEARPHSVLVSSASTLIRDTAASAPPFHSRQKKKANSVVAVTRWSSRQTTNTHQRLLKFIWSAILVQIPFHSPS